MIRNTIFDETDTFTAQVVHLTVQISIWLKKTWTVSAYSIASVALQLMQWMPSCEWWCWLAVHNSFTITIFSCIYPANTHNQYMTIPLAKSHIQKNKIVCGVIYQTDQLCKRPVGPSREGKGVREHRVAAAQSKQRIWCLYTHSAVLAAEAWHRQWRPRQWLSYSELLIAEFVIRHWFACRPMLFHHNKTIVTWSVLASLLTWCINCVKWLCILRTLVYPAGPRFGIHKSVWTTGYMRKNVMAMFFFLYLP